MLFVREKSIKTSTRILDFQIRKKNKNQKFSLDRNQQKYISPTKINLPSSNGA
jgi:hypothetical protein